MISTIKKNKILENPYYKCIENFVDQYDQKNDSRVFKDSMLSCIIIYLGPPHHDVLYNMHIYKKNVYIYNITLVKITMQAYNHKHKRLFVLPPSKKIQNKFNKLVFAYIKKNIKL